MERDNNRRTDADATDDTTDVSRRNVLKTTGALGALAVGGALSGSAAAAPNTEPETIEGSYEVVLEDGDVLANKHIKSNGSSVSIVARGSDWEIRNVGIEGKPPENPITVRVTDSGGSGLIENVYVEGVGSSDETPIFVHRKHEGTLTIRHVNVGNTPETHGIYASAPGSPSWRKQGGGGAVQIEKCYAHDLGWNGFRIGTDGSYVKDSVAANCGNSGVWNQWQRGRVENVSIDAGVNAFNVGANNHRNRDGECELSVSNVEYDAPNEVRKADGIGDWDFFSASNLTETSSPDLSPPSGVPMSASEAASGGGSSGSSSSSGSSDEGVDTSDEGSSDGSDESSESTDEEESTNEDSESEDTSVPDSAVPVEVTADSSNDGSIDYELTADGTFYRSSDDDSEDSADGSNASGTVWPGFTDTFYLDGEVTSFDHDGEATVTVDGSTVDAGSDGSSGSSADEETETDSSDSDSEDDTESGDDVDSSAGENRSLEVEGTGSTTDGPREYSLTVTGTITDLEGNPDDTVSGGDTVDGKVWAPFFDRYAFSGEIDSFETDGDVEVRVDGETVDPDSL